MVRKLGCVLVAAMASAAPAAPRPSLLTLWMVQPPVDPVGVEREVKDGETVLRQRLLPTGLATLDADAQDPGGAQLLVRAGTQLVQAMTATGKVYCALATLKPDKKTGALAENRNGMTLCFLDGDGNGRFELVAEMAGGIGLLMVSGPLPKEPRAVDVAYTVQPPTTITGDFFVGIRYEQYFNIYGNRMFFTDFGGRGHTESLTDFGKWKSKGPFPLTSDVSGVRITVLSAAAKGARLRVDQPLPPRPFAVMTYTTTSFIPIRY